jgi:hypothetical protein
MFITPVALGNIKTRLVMRQMIRYPACMKSRCCHSSKSQFFIITALTWCLALPAADIRIGIIGCDTSHVTAFTESLNNPDAKEHIEGGKIVAAFKGGSPDIPSSANRVEGYAKTLQNKFGVKFYDSIEEMCKDVDAVLLESVDGRPHLQQAKPVIKAHKPMFIDKPMAGSLKDAIEIFRLAREANVPVFSSSGLRFSKTNQLIRQGLIGKVTYAETYGPCEIEPHHPDLFWYGIHGVEALFTVMGTGCESVQRGKPIFAMAGKYGPMTNLPVSSAEERVEVKGAWRGNRYGWYRADKGFHGLAKGDKGEAPAGSFDGYVPLVRAIMEFFKTGVAPVKPEETIEILAFMVAADESKREGGKEIRLADVIKKAGGN